MAPKNENENAEKPAADVKPEQTQAPKQEEKTEKVQDAKYPISRFLSVDGYALTGYPSHVRAGALAGKTNDISVEQAKQAADKFLNSEVQEG